MTMEQNADSERQDCPECSASVSEADPQGHYFEDGICQLCPACPDHGGVRVKPEIGNRRSRCRWCDLIIAPAGGPWVDVETLDSCCERCMVCEDGESRSHEPTSSRWKVKAAPAEGSGA